MRFGSFVNHVTAQQAPTLPKVGDGATILHWSDRSAATVTRVERERNRDVIYIQKDLAVRIDTNGMSDCQTYSYALDPSAPEERVVLRQTKTRSAWRTKSGDVVVFGHRNAYHDYSF